MADFLAAAPAGNLYVGRAAMPYRASQVILVPPFLPTPDPQSIPRSPYELPLTRIQAMNANWRLDPLAWSYEIRASVTIPGFGLPDTVLTWHKPEEYVGVPAVPGPSFVRQSPGGFERICGGNPGGDLSMYPLIGSHPLRHLGDPAGTFTQLDLY